MCRGTRREGVMVNDRSQEIGVGGKKGRKRRKKKEKVKRTHLVQTFPENLYREIPRLEIVGLE